MEQGELVELDITGVAHGGVFVAREPEGRVVFVSDTIPGERVRARITDVKKSFARAETVEVLEASPDRVPHVWAASAGSEQPGGADLGHISLARQRALKGQVLREAFAKFASLEIDADVVGPEAVLGDKHPEAAATRDGLRYRTRITLHVDGSGRIGPFAPRSPPPRASRRRPPGRGGAGRPPRAPPGPTPPTTTPSRPRRWPRSPSPCATRRRGGSSSCSRRTARSGRSAAPIAAGTGEDRVRRGPSRRS